MEKVCVFCGKHPESKSSEHVLPQWLIELTGSPKRVARFGLDHNKDKSEPRYYSFDSFKFPACQHCNNSFSELENLTKPIVSKMLSHEAISASEIVTLLDWFDKVRIGLWLAYYYLNKNTVGIVPNFYITQRMRLYDRMLLICRSDNPQNFLSFVGCDTPVFTILPSCFCLIVNHLVFLNISYPFLFSRRFGFPYPSECYSLPNNPGFGIKFAAGRQRMMRPLLKKSFMLQGTELYQPIFSLPKKESSVYSLYDNDYVKTRTIEWDKGLGKVYYRDIESYSAYPNDSVPQWTPKEKYPFIELAYHTQLLTLEWQLEILKMAPSLAKLAKDKRQEQRKLYQTCAYYQKELIKTLVQRAQEADISLTKPV